MATHSSKTTTDHDKIRRWVEARGGKPATVKRTEKGGEPGVLRIDFPGYSGEGTLEEISWEDFFEKFEEAELAFVYQEKTAEGEQSRFSKLVRRTQQEEGGGHPKEESSGHHKASSKSKSKKAA